MERLRLWRYKKLATENVKKKEVIEKPSDHEDYSSCFKLRKTLKNSCRKLIMKNRTTKKIAFNDLTSIPVEENFIKKRKKQRTDETEEHRKTLHSCFQKIMKTRHDLFLNTPNEISDPYITSGIYDKFGNSCTESLKHCCQLEKIVDEDLRTATWFHNSKIGKLSEEILRHQNPGSFIIHQSLQKSGNFILSLRTYLKVVHYTIIQSKRGYRLKGASKLFSTISSLVTHHSVMAEQLPLALIVRRNYEVSRKLNKDDNFSSIEDLGEFFTDLKLE